MNNSEKRVTLDSCPVFSSGARALGRRWQWLGRLLPRSLSRALVQRRQGCQRSQAGRALPAPASSVWRALSPRLAGTAGRPGKVVRRGRRFAQRNPGRRPARTRTVFMAVRPEAPPDGSQSVRRSGETGQRRRSRGTQESGGATAMTKDEQPRAAKLEAGDTAGWKPALRSADFQSAVSRISNPPTHGKCPSWPAGSRPYSKWATHRVRPKISFALRLIALARLCGAPHHLAP